MALTRTFLDGDLLTSADINDHLVHRVPNPGDVYDTGWTPITFTSNWKSYGGSFATCAVRRIGSVVYMKGLASNTASAGIGSVIGSIPAQFRPLGTRLIPQVPGASTLISGPASTGTAHTHGITTSGTSMRITVNATTGDIVYDGPATLSGLSYVGLEATWTVD